MAYSTTNKFNNAMVGIPKVGADVDIYEVTSSPKYAVGTGFTRSDGAEFRYCHFGTVVSRAGLLVAQDLSESGTALLDNVCVTPANATAVPGIKIKPNDIGSEYIQFTKGCGDNQYAGGYFQIGDGTGEGYTFRIRESDTGNVSGSNQLRIWGKLPIALDATTDFRIYGCKWANVESATVTVDAFPVGVTCAPVTTAGYYGWVQSKGIVGIVRDASGLAAGEVVRMSEEHAGNVSRMDYSTQIGGGKTGHSTLFDDPIVGYCIDGAADTEAALCCINL